MDRSLRILIVEDNESDAELALRELRKGVVRFEAMRVVTREEYLGELEHQPPDLILADYALPSFDGLAALAIAQKTCPDVPFIIVSGELGEERAVETLKRGATDYVLKDRLSRLLPAVRRALEEAEERKRRREAEEQVRTRTAELEAANSQLQSQADEIRRQAVRAEALVHTAERLNGQLSLEAVLQAICEQTARALGVPAVRVALYDEKRDEIRHAAGYGLPPEYARRVQPMPRVSYEELVRQGGPILLVPDVQALRGTLDAELYVALGIRSMVGISIVRNGQLIGDLNLFTFGDVLHFSPDDFLLLQGLASQAASAIANAWLFEEVQRGRQHLRDLSHHLVTLQEGERKALSQGLHDTAGQSMTAVKLGLGLLRREAEGAPAVQARVDDLLQTADRAAQELHDLAVSLRPSTLDRYGLVPALEQLLTSFRKHTPVQVDFMATGLDDERLAGEVETALYRIVQEGLTNIARHAQATSVGVMVSRNGDEANLILEDDGCGFDVDEALRRGRLGLLGMRERAEMLGGTLTIEGKPGCGTTLYVAVPAQPAAATGTSGGLDAIRLAYSPPGQTTDGDAAAEQPGLAAAELARAKALSDALVEITVALVASGASASAQQIFEVILAKAAGALGCESAHIMAHDGDAWIVTHAFGMPDSIKTQRFREAPRADWVAQNRQVLTDGLETSPIRVSPEQALQFGIRSQALAPLQAHEQVLAVLALNRHAAATVFQPSEVDFLRRLAALTSLALENLQLREIETRQRNELAQRVEELQSLLDVLPIGIGIAHDTACKDIHVNPAFPKTSTLPEPWPARARSTR